MRGAGEYWILDADRCPVRTTSIDEWGRCFRSSDRIVKQEMINDVRVSTVFLGIDHQFGDGPPLLFETMIFGGEHDEYQDRCSTWSEAVEMHNKACAIVRGEIEE